MSLPFASPIPTGDLADEFYPEDSKRINKVLCVIVHLKKLGWHIQHHTKSRYTLSKQHYGLLKAYCTAKKQDVPEWPKNLRLTPDNMRREAGLDS